MKKIKTAILISGRGSNMKSLIKACEDEKFPAEISLVISNKQDALGLKFAQEQNIATKFIDHRAFSSRKEFDEKISQEIEKHNCEIVCLAGFMRLLSKEFTLKWHNRAINIHPSLLPDFKGANAVRDALAAKATKSGCTTHLVRHEMDSGPIIMQAQVDIFADDNEETLAQKILEQEHKIYPQSLKKLCEMIKNNEI